MKQRPQSPLCCLFPSQCLPPRHHAPRPLSQTGKGDYRHLSGVFSDLHKCVFCPTAFHIGCIPPGSRFNDKLVICANHPDVPLPCVERGLLPLHQNPFAWFWATIAPTTESDHFPYCLPTGYQVRVG